jgi:hypothetical protein
VSRETEEADFAFLARLDECVNRTAGREDAFNIFCCADSVELVEVEVISAQRFNDRSNSFWAP